MTRDEVIQVLRDWDGCFIGHRSDDVNEALNMAIKALEQEPTTKNNLGVDCVSRQAVLDEIDDTNRRGGFGCKLSYTRCRGHIEQLPLITPQEPQSEWEHDHEILKAYSDGANEVLDKIRAEIEQEIIPRNSDQYDHEAMWQNMGLRMALKVIDKHKAESEEA